MIQIEIDGSTFLHLNLALAHARDENGNLVLLRGARLNDPCRSHGEGCIRLPDDVHVYSSEATGSVFRPFTVVGEDDSKPDRSFQKNVII